MITLQPATGTVLERFEQQLADFLSNERTRAALRGLRFEQLWRQIERLTAGGKRVRPQLLLHAHAMLGGTDEATAHRAAVALEALHTALLVHDDMLDRDFERRGQPNIAGHFAARGRRDGARDAQALAWGEANALLAGDLLLTAAMRELALLPVDADTRERVIRAADAGIAAAAAGEQSDIAFGFGLDTPDADAILHMMHQKTAVYSFESPLQIAAALAGASDDVSANLTEIGRSLGLIFQMRDDVLGVFGDPVITGKSALSDLREGKRTLLIAHAARTEQWPNIAEGWGDPQLDEPGAARLRELLERCGARAAAEDAIEREAERARALIGAAWLPDDLERMLHAEVRRGSERVA